MRPTRALIHIENLKNNFLSIKSLLSPETKICCAVKADAYGHGVKVVAEKLVKLGVNYLAVASVEEGIELRNQKINTPILVLSPIVEEDIPNLLTYNLEIVVTDWDFLKQLESCAKKMKLPTMIHLKIDTGMGRLGCRPKEALEMANHLFNSPYFLYKGTCTHLASSDLPENKIALEQIRIFTETITSIKESGINPGIVHASNSGGILYYPEAHFDMVRAGIILYGYLPDASQTEVRKLFKPVMELESKIIFKKEVASGVPISYGGTYTTSKKTTIVTIPVGYADGYSRNLSNRGPILIKDKNYTVSGRICMDQLLVDLHDPKTLVNRYEKVVFFGPDKNGPDAQTLADLCNTIPYEILCCVSKRVPRIYIEE